MPQSPVLERPRWFPGYAVASVATLGLIATAPGQTMLVSLLNAPLREALGIDRVVLNTTYTAATMAAALPLTVVGRWTDRWGPRRMLVLVSLAFGLGCGVLSLAAGLPSLLLGFFLVRFLGQGSLSLVSSHAVAMWFHRRLGVVHGLQQVVLFGVWTLVPTGTVLLIEAVGWRGTWRVFAVVVPLLVAPAAWWLVRDRPEDVGLGLDNDAHAGEAELTGMSPTEALRTAAYWRLLVTYALPPLVGTALLFDLQPILIARGLLEQDAALAIAGWSGAVAVMSLPSGWLADRVAPRWLLASGLIGFGLACLALSSVTSAIQAAGAMALAGAGQALIMSSAGATVARYFGRLHHGAVRSSLTRVGVLGTGLGPLLSGWGAGLLGDQGMLLALGLTTVPAAWFVAGLRPPPGTTDVS